MVARIEGCEVQRLKGSKGDEVQRVKKICCEGVRVSKVMRIFQRVRLGRGVRFFKEWGFYKTKG